MSFYNINGNTRRKTPVEPIKLQNFLFYIQYTHQRNQILSQVVYKSNIKTMKMYGLSSDI